MRSRPLVVTLVLAGACHREPEVVTETVTVTQTVTNTVTNTTTEPGAAPGRYEQPLQQLARVFDDKGAVGTHGVLEDHMHVDEVQYRDSDQRFFYCGYTFGVVDVSDPAKPSYLAQGYEWDLGSPVDRNTGCLHVDWDDSDPDIVYVSHRGNIDFQPHLSVVDLNTTYDPYDVYLEDPFLVPVQADPLRETDVSYEGLDAENGYVYVALHAGGLGVFQRDPATNELSRVGVSTFVANAYDVEVVGNLAYVVDEQQGLYVIDVTDPAAHTLVSSLFLGGVDRDIAVDGDYAYIAGGGAGLVVVDISDPAAPALVSYTDTYGTTVRVEYDAGRVAVAAWNDVRIFDVTDPAAPELIAAARLETDKTYVGDEGNERPDITARNLGIDLHDDNVYVGNWWTPYTYKLHEDRQAPYMVLPEDIYYMGVGTVDVGATGTYTMSVRNQGTAPLTIVDAWTTNSAFVVTPETAVLDPGAETVLTITYSATTTDEESAIVNIVTDDPAYPVRKGYVVGNAEGIGVGDPFPYTEATDVNTLASWTSDEIAGKVTLVAYFANF